MQPVTVAATGCERAVWAEHMLACLQQLGARRTNAVLELLAGVDRGQMNRHYPQPPLRFGGLPLRAYYHCHPARGRAAAEHGHFHVFIRVAGIPDRQDSFAHVAALSVDQAGQPIGWAALNQWVTGGPWLPAQALRLASEARVAQTALNLTERWLVAMLGLFQTQVTQLLAARDATLARLGARRPDLVLHADRTIYQLAFEPVDLRGALAAALG